MNGYVGELWVQVYDLSRKNQVECHGKKIRIRNMEFYIGG